jgi:hypothetical protein
LLHIPGIEGCIIVIFPLANIQVHISILAPIAGIRGCTL